MLRAVIGDENRNDRHILKKMLEKVPELIVEGEASNGPDLIQLVEKTLPQIVFIDIDMTGMSGFEAALAIAEVNPKTFIIFSTDCDSFATEAFDAYAFYYMVKPYDFDRINKTIKRVKEIIHNYSRHLRGIDDKLNNFSSKNQHMPQRIFIEKDDAIIFVKTSEIRLITRKDRKTIIHTTDGVHKISDTLEVMESKLGHDFFRCHKGYIINTNMITKVEPWGNKTYMVTFADTQETALMTFERFKQFKQIYCIE